MRSGDIIHLQNAEKLKLTAQRYGIKTNKEFLIFKKQIVNPELIFVME